MKRSYLTLGFRNLTRRKSRTLLTLTGVALAIGFTVGLLSISEGFMKSFDRVMGTSGPELFVVPQGQGKMPFPMSMGCAGGALEERSVSVMGGIQGVTMAEPMIRMFASKKDAPGMLGDMPMLTFAVPPETFFRLRPDAKIKHGRAMRKSDNRVYIAGFVLAQNLELKLGDSLLVGGESFRVTGIMDRAGQPYDYFGYVPLAAAQQIRELDGKVCGVMVKLDNPARAKDASRRIKALFPKVDIQSVEEIADSFQDMMMMSQAVHFAVSCFALLIGVLFVATTMIMSVSERVREFATIRVIGASRGFVVKMIMAESLILSLLGGAAGCLLGYGLSKGIDWLNFVYFRESFMQTWVSPKILIIATAVSLLIGTFAGIVPALAILKRPMAENLRYE